MSYEKAWKPGGTCNPMLKRILQIFSLAILFSAPAAISESTRAKMILGSGQDGSNPIEVTSDNASFGGQTNVTTFSGNVAVVQGNVELFAKEVIVRNSPDDKLDVVEIELSGNVSLATDGGFATADYGLYDIDAKLIVLTGNVVVEIHEQEARITGETLNYNVENGETVVIGDS